MDFVYLKIVLLLNGWLITKGSPVAMLQHATSSQSIVFQTAQALPPTPSVATQSSTDPQGVSQPKYEYKYEVSDHHTGDRKSHWETRDGDKVRGAYTLYEPDGALRTVEYTADGLHGFNALVTRNIPSKHQQSQTSHTNNQAFPNIVNGVPSNVQDRNPISNTGYRGEYPKDQHTHNGGVSFSVDHVTGNIGGHAP